MNPVELVRVKPKSKKAKNRLCNLMGNNDMCIVEQNRGNGELFLAAQNGKYFFWVNTNSSDPNWEVLE